MIQYGASDRVTFHAALIVMLSFSIILLEMQAHSELHLHKTH